MYIFKTLIKIFLDKNKKTNKKLNSTVFLFFMSRCMFTIKQLVKLIIVKYSKNNKSKYLYKM